MGVTKKGCTGFFSSEEERKQLTADSENSSIGYQVKQAVKRIMRSRYDWHWHSFFNWNSKFGLIALDVNSNKVLHFDPIFYFLMYSPKSIEWS